tara:strand:- start:836 stop:1576 length:741 start_codon:yes stop_codon:yes gene_type:complete
MSETGKIVKEDGTTVWIADDGREYKSKSGMWKRNKKLEGVVKTRKSLGSDKAKEKVESASPPPSPEPSEPESVDWVTMDFGDAPVTEVIPAPLKRIKPRGASTGKPTKKQLEAERQMNEGILVTGYKTGDYLMTRYKRGVLDDPEAEAITHMEDDYEWIAGVTQDGLEAQGLNLAGAIGPGGLAVIANGVWFGTPLVRIQKEANKSPFQGRIGGAVGRFVERLPFIGKRIKERRLRTLEDELNQQD